MLHIMEIAVKIDDFLIFKTIQANSESRYEHRDPAKYLNGSSLFCVFLSNNSRKSKL